MLSRRDPQEGLLATLKLALAKALEPHIFDLVEDMMTWDVKQLLEKHVSLPTNTEKEEKPAAEFAGENVPPNPFHEKVPKLVIMLDQVEETFTRPLSSKEHNEYPIRDEWEQFLEELSPILLSPRYNADVKVILGFRKEYHPEIKAYCEQFGLSWKDVFLRPLDAQGIREVVEGIQSTPRLKKKYKVEVEESDEDAPPLYQRR